MRKPVWRRWMSGSVLAAWIALGWPASSPAQQLQWVASTESAPWKHMDVPAPTAQQPDDPGSVLATREAQTFQTMDGFGGCFNELGWQALQALDQNGRGEVLAALFSPSGAGFKLGRVPMGANDFAKDWYSLDETPGDFALSHFSLDRDRQNLIPFVKAAMKFQPELAVWGVPWSPPLWMKTNGQYKGGELKTDASTLQSYALLFSKFVQGYRAEGIHLYAVMPQNEPNYNNNVYPQALVSPAALNVFVRDFLAPRLQQDKVDVELWLGAIVKPAAEYIDAALRDPVTSRDIVGVGLQYEGQRALARTHEEFPSKKLAQTETECYNGANTWDEGLTTFGNIIRDTDNFAGSYFFWNLVLDETGLSHWGWKQNSLVTVHRETGRVTYNPEFFAMRHFSAYVHPGAKRIAVTGSPLKQAVAFRNPSGEVVILFENASAQPVPVSLRQADAGTALTIPPRSMNTLILPPGARAHPKE